MTEETTQAPPKRGRPPRKASKEETSHIATGANDPVPYDWLPSRLIREDHPEAGMIPAPPLHIEDAKAIEWMDWIFTYLPNEMARNFYGGRNHTPGS